MPSEVSARVTPAELLQRSHDLLRRSEREAALELAVAVLDLGDDRARAEALCIIATCRRVQDEHPEALTAALRAAELSVAAGDLAVEARARGEVTRVLIEIGETDEALTEARTTLKLAEASGDLNILVAGLATLANAYLGLQQFDLAVAVSERAAETARLTGDEITSGAMLDTAACALLGVAEVAQAANDREAEVRAAQSATERSQTAMLIARKHGHRRYEATALANLAEGLAVAGNPEQGLALLDTWPTDPDLDPRYTITQHLDTRGSIWLMMGRPDEAIKHYTRAVDLAEGKSIRMAYCEHLAWAYEQNGNLAEALAMYKEFHLLYCQVASEAAQRNARVAAVRLETEEAKASVVRLERLCQEDA